MGDDYMRRKEDPVPGKFSRPVLGMQYFIYFGVLGVVLPYFNLYCYHLGFSGSAIGILSAVRTVCTVVFPVFWGVVADRFSARRPIYLTCTVASAVSWAFFLFYADFTAMVVISAVYGFFYAPVISFLEAFAMEILGPQKSRYGRVRAWGSLAFITMVMAMGRLIDTYSARIILPVVLFGSALLAAAALLLPRTESDRPPAIYKKPEGMFTTRMGVFLFSAFLMLVSHGTYYGFFSIHLEKLGFHGQFIGIAWALGSGSEILVMYFSERLFARFSITGMLTFSFAAAVLRWALLAVVSSPAAILAAQLLHAVTYGVFHMSSILYMDRLTPKEGKTLGQAVNNAVTYGMGIMAGFLLNGFLFESAGARALFFISAGLAFIGGAVLWGYERAAGKAGS